MSAATATSPTKHSNSNNNNNHSNNNNHNPSEFTSSTDNNNHNNNSNHNHHLYDSQQQQHSSSNHNHNNNHNNNKLLPDTSQNSGASSVMPAAEAVNFGDHPPQRPAATGAEFSRRVTLGGGQPGATSTSATTATTTTAYPAPHDRRNSMSSLSLMDDIFGKRASMGLGSTAAYSAMQQQQQPPHNATGAGGTDDHLSMNMGGGASSSSMFGGNRRGSMDSTTAALDAAIFDLTRRRYSMAGSSLIGGGNSVVGSGGVGGGGGATINSLAGGDRSTVLPPGMEGEYNPATFEERRSSLEMGSGGGGGPNMDYGGGADGSNPGMLGAGLMPQNVSSGMGGMGGMYHGGPRMHPNMTSNIAARQQQLQAQQRELERRQRELEQQRRDLIASMQHRKIMMQRPPGGGGGGPTPGGGGGNDLRYANQSSFNDPLTGPYNSSHSVPSGMHNTSDHSSRGGPMGQGTQNSGGSSGSQQWWICQVCNTKAFASHDEALAHEAICTHAKNPGRYGDPNYPSNYSTHSGNSSGISPQRARGRRGGGPRGGLEMSPSSSKYAASTGMDSSMRTVHTTATTNSYEPVYSTGPFATLEKPLPLAMPTDKDWLTPLHCFVRKHCVEVFCASEADVAAPSKGKRKPIQVGQIGIRCPHCHPNSPSMIHKMKQQGQSVESAHKARERGSVYYPTTIASIYNATMNLLQRHLHSCTAVPKEVMSRYETLKSDDARSGTSKKYWIESALSIGLVDTEMGIRFSASTPPPLPQLTDSQKDMQKHIKDQTNTGAEGNSGNADAQQDNQPANLDRSDTNEAEPAPLTAPEDKSYSTAFSYHLLSQMKPCVFTEADRLGKRKGLPPGFPGLACRHCFGGYGSGRFFPSSIKTLSDTSKTLNVLHNHMIRCRKCPTSVRETLEHLRGTHDEERAKMKFGSQKAFFARIWDRLHGNGTPQKDALPSSAATSPKNSPKRKAPPKKTPPVEESDANKRPRTEVPQQREPEKQPSET